MAKAMTVDQIMEILKRCPFTPWQQVAQAIHDALPEEPESSATIEVTTHSATVTYPDGGYVLFRGELANALKLHEPGTYRLAVERVKPEPTAERCVWPAETRQAAFEHHHRRSPEMEVNPQVNCSACGTAVRLEMPKCWGCGRCFTGNRMMGE